MSAPILTAKTCEKLQPHATKRIEIRDGNCPGLRLVIQPSGVKSWAVRFRHDRRQVKMTLGGFPAVSLADARTKARAAIDLVSTGKNPAAQKTAAAAVADAPDVETLTAASPVATVYAAYIVRHIDRNLRASTAAQFKSILGRVIPTWGRRAVGDIGKADILKAIDDATDRGATAGNACRAVLRAFFGWVAGRGIIDVNPVAGIAKPSVLTARERVLSDAEIAKFWAGCETMGAPFGKLFQLLLLTGCRRNEIAHAQWSDVDTEKRTFSIPASRSKNKSAHTVYLSDAALAIIESLPRVADCESVFSCKGKKACNNFTKAKERADKASGLADWTLHDLRRTCATGLAGLRIAPHVIEAVLNHRSGQVSGVARVYNRFTYADESAAAMAQWGAKVAALVKK